MPIRPLNAIALAANLLLGASFLRAEDTVNESSSPGEIIAVSKDRRYRLRLAHVVQEKSPWDPDICAATMRFQLAFSEDGLHFLSSVPKDTYIESVDPLVDALLATGKSIANNRHSGWADDFGPSIYHLEVGNEQSSLHKLKLTVALVTVTEWHQLEFRNLKRSDNDYLHCGPFELTCEGDDKQVNIGAAAYPEFLDEHEEYKKQIPLKFLTHRYAIRHIEIADAKNRKFSLSIGTFSGGAAGGRFSILETSTQKQKVAVQSNAPLIVPTSEEPISYPVSIRIKLPKRYTTEHLSFEFEKVELPPLQASFTAPSK